MLLIPYSTADCHPSAWSVIDGLQRILTCYKPTLANAQAGQLEVRKRKYGHYMIS